MKYVNTFLLQLLLINCLGQSIDFGIEVQQNNNKASTHLWSNEASRFNRAFSYVDLNSDTVDVHFTNFSMANNFEMPIYFRLNAQKRYFLDLKFSGSSHTFTMNGVSNYAQSYYEQNYGTYDDFLAQAQADGFDTVSQDDYNNYINATMAQNEQPLRSTEEFKLLIMSANFGVRLFPHRSIKPYLTAGMTFKRKYEKVNYHYVDFNKPNVYREDQLFDGVNKFLTDTWYFNFGMGAEFYRFRFGVYYQMGFSFQFANTSTNDVVVNVNAVTPFDRIYSYGFCLSSNLFSAPLGKRVTKEELNDDQLLISNIKKKQSNWDIGLRYNRRGFNTLSSFYENPENQLNLMTRDSILFNHNGSIVSAEKIEFISLGKVQRIAWSGQLEFIVSKNFNERLSVELSVGYSNLKIDIASTEFTATVIHGDSINPSSYYYSSSEPRIRPGAYRTNSVIINNCFSASYQILSRDLFSLRIKAGLGYSRITYTTPIVTPDGVNELTIYEVFNLNPNHSDLSIHLGSVNLDPEGNPDDLFSSFDDPSTGIYPRFERYVFPTFRVGFEAEIERFMLGFSFEKNLGYMDGFLLNQYATFYLSLGYKIWRL